MPVVRGRTEIPISGCVLMSPRSTLQTKLPPRCNYEVLRRSDDFYFRSVPRPKNLRALEGVPEKSPLEFLNPVPEGRNVLWEKPGAPALDATAPSK